MHSATRNHSIFIWTILVAVPALVVVLCALIVAGAPALGPTVPHIFS